MLYQKILLMSSVKTCYCLHNSLKFHGIHYLSGVLVNILVQPLFLPLLVPCFCDSALVTWGFAISGVTGMLEGATYIFIFGSERSETYDDKYSVSENISLLSG